MTSLSYTRNTQEMRGNRDAREAKEARDPKVFLGCLEGWILKAKIFTHAVKVHLLSLLVSDFRPSPVK